MLSGPAFLSGSQMSLSRKRLSYEDMKMASIARDKIQQPMIISSEAGDFIQIDDDHAPDMFSV